MRWKFIWWKSEISYAVKSKVYILCHMNTYYYLNFIQMPDMSEYCGGSYSKIDTLYLV